MSNMLSHMFKTFLIISIIFAQARMSLVDLSPSYEENCRDEEKAEN